MYKGMENIQYKNKKKEKMWILQFSFVDIVVMYMFMVVVRCFTVLLLTH